MCQCENGHTFCEEHLIDDIQLEDKRKFALSRVYISEEDKEKIKNMTDEEFENYFDEEDDVSGEFDYGCPSRVCPICNFKKITDEDAKLYLFRKYNLTTDILTDIIKNEFGSYEDFDKFIK